MMATYFLKKNLYMVTFYKLLTNGDSLGIRPSNPEFLMGTNQIWSGVNLIKAETSGMGPNI